MSPELEAWIVYSWLPLTAAGALVILAGILLLAGLAVRGLWLASRHLAGYRRPVELPLEWWQDTARLTAEDAAAARTETARCRRLAAAWRAADDPVTVAAGWELDAVLDGLVLPEACGGDPKTIAMRAVIPGRCPVCRGDMETCRCGTEKPWLPRTAGGAR